MARYIEDAILFQLDQFDKLRQARKMLDMDIIVSSATIIINMFIYILRENA